MKCPSLAELPPPPPGRQGWPWTEAAPPVGSLPGGAPWPRLTIVTPSYNQGAFIEETLRSVLLQGYPDLEYVVIDGGSTDDSVAIIRKYERWLTRWVSEPDRGQSDAINKGLAGAAGAVVGWINSDDTFLPAALSTLARLRHAHPAAVGWAGACRRVDRDGRFLERFDVRLGDRDAIADWWHAAVIPQPSCLFSAEAWRQVGGLNEAFHYIMDAEVMLRLSALGPFASTTQEIAVFRSYPEAKTSQRYVARLAEMVASNVVLGFSRVAERQLQRHIDHERGMALDALDARQRVQLMDAVPFRTALAEMACYVTRRAGRAFSRRRPGPRGTGG